jgi:hypothetical protein
MNHDCASALMLSASTHPLTHPPHPPTTSPTPLPQVIAYLAGLHYSGLWRPSLVVAPTTLLRQWMRELRAWYPPLRALLLHESGRCPPGTPRPDKRGEAWEGGKGGQGVMFRLCLL